MTRVGFIINSRVPSREAMRAGMPPWGLWMGWDDKASPMSFMRFHWVARELRRRGVAEYRLFRPGLGVDAVVFLKSMGAPCMELAETLRAQGIAIIFEANVDYYTRCTSTDVAMRDLAPTPRQREDAVAITTLADGVIASSRHLAGVCVEFNPQAQWIPDHVDLALRPKRGWPGPTIRDGVLHVWWSGMASKAFELLVAEHRIRSLGSRVHLHLVTDDLSARERWKPEVRERFENFLRAVPHTVHPFRDVRGLLALYAHGGVIISPRTLDTPYNHSHTEWKITLGMACGLPAIASPVPSYRDVADRTAPEAIRICESDAEWSAAFDAILSASQTESVEAARAAVAVVETEYCTEVVAPRHLEAVESIINAQGPA